MFGPVTWWIIVDGLDLNRTVALGALTAFIALAWFVLRKVDDTAREWSPEDRLVVSESPGSSQT